jgi:hypothetical protein
MRSNWSKSLIILYIAIVFTSPFLGTATASGGGYYTDSFPLQTFDYRMYVVSLNISQTFIVNVTAVADGEFDLFLFSTRPSQSYVSRNIDDPYDPEIFNIATGTTLDFDIPVALYYIQVVLRANGPDSYILEANTEQMELYFIPFIPSYNLWIIVGVSASMVGLIFFSIKRRMIKH